jgi:lipoate-protein ligase A
MAIDEALLDDAGRSGAAFLRLYRWDPPCFSLGRNERAVEHPGTDTVRRPTGGSTVWHEHEVTYAVAAPIAIFGRLKDAYHGIHERLAAALRSLGVDASLADRPAVGPSARPRPQGSPLGSVRPASCFATTAGGEILVRGRKLVGSAQARRGAAFLQHGSILLDGPQGMVNATTLQQVLGRPVSFEEVSAAIVETWAGAGRLSVTR